MSRVRGAAAWGKGDKRRLSRRDYPGSVLQLIAARDGGVRCALCGAGDDPPLQVDHRMPLAEGGDNHHLNLQFLCARCNQSKGAHRAPPRRIE